MKSLLAICILLLVTESFGKQLPVAPLKGFGDPPAVRSSSLNLLPENTVVSVGETAVLRCGVEDPDVPHTVQWTEYAYFELGGVISANEFVGSHPNAARYQIIHSGDRGEPGEYSLEILDVALTDGGTYMCMDTQAVPPNKRQHSLELTVLAAAPNCSTTLPATGAVLEGAYHTNDCQWEYQGGLIPNMEWTGPGDFQQLTVSTPSSVWSGMQFTVQYSMDTLTHVAETSFTDYFLPQPPNSADNVPTFRFNYPSRQMYVYWAPRNHVITPVKQFYDAGDILTCTADSFPMASFSWQNLRTLEEAYGNTWRVDESWRGFNQSIRCSAVNGIDGQLYPSNVFLAVDVLPLTTPTTTTPSTTTTPPPPVSDCRDLSGSWISEAPTPARLCIELDLNNYGALTGLFMNDSETFSVDLVGRSQAANFGQLGFNGIWPLEIGVSSFIGECHRCYGEEQLLMNVVHRSKGTTCGQPGPVYYTTLYHFKRSNIPTQCPGFPPNPN